MSNGSKSNKHILLVEDTEGHECFYRGEIKELEKHYGSIRVTSVDSFQEVDEFVQKVKGSKEKVDCAVVDMEIWQHRRADRTPDEGVDIHWGIQAFKRIQEIVVLKKVLIVTAYSLAGHLMPVGMKRVMPKSVHPQDFRDKVAQMLK